jgi:hypothetical protein
MYDEDHGEQDSPSRKGTCTSANVLLVKEESDRNRTNYLGDPIYKVVQRSCANVEQCTVIIVEFCGIRQRDGRYG